MIVLAQALGVAAFFLEVVSLQFRRKVHIVIILCVAAVLFAISYYMLGALTGAAVNIVSAVRALTVYSLRKRKPHKAVLLIFLAAFLVVGAITWQGWVSILPVIGMLLSTYGLWQHNEQTLRKTFLAGSPLWLLYGIINGSIGTVLNELFSMTSASIALLRFRKISTP